MVRFDYSPGVKSWYCEECDYNACEICLQKVLPLPEQSSVSFSEAPSFLDEKDEEVKNPLQIALQRSFVRGPINEESIKVEIQVRTYLLNKLYQDLQQ